MEILPFPEIERIAEPQSPAVEHAAAWWWWVGAAVMGLIVLGIIIGVIAGLTRRAVLPAAPARPEKLALREIKALRRRAGSLEAPAFGAALSEIIRTCLHRRMGMLARFATTEEILGKSRRRNEAPPPPLVTVFTGVLEGCDALKFGSSTGIDRDRLLSDAETALHTVAAAVKHPAPAPPVHTGPALSDAPAA